MQVLFIQIAILEAREDELKVVLFSCNLSLERLYHGNHEKKSKTTSNPTLPNRIFFSCVRDTSWR